MTNKFKKECKHCKFIERLCKYLLACPDYTYREYWLITEFFVYLHDGDVCNPVIIPENF